MTLILDELGELEKLDSQDILGIMRNFRKQVEDALELVQGIQPSTKEISDVLVLGMGGSAIGADLVRCFCGRIPVPYQVLRGYDIPGHVRESTLVVASSYSGNTEETLFAFREAVEQDSEIWCFTSGGSLKNEAEKKGLKTLNLPGGQPPRTAFMYTFVGLVGLLQKYGIVREKLGLVEASLPWIQEILDQFGPNNPQAHNPAKKLAVKLIGRIPVIYGSDGRLEFVARRWAAQVNENSKQLAFHSSVPEMNHNEIVGWKNPDISIGEMIPVFLQDQGDHHRIRARFQIMKEMASNISEEFAVVDSKGASWMERLWYLILLGDFASVYLAFLNQENPTEIQAIGKLKERLSLV
jgi:glucose/mannose-6-phosphate isomerase